MAFFIWSVFSELTRAMNKRTKCEPVTSNSSELRDESETNFILLESEVETPQNIVAIENPTSTSLRDFNESEISIEIPDDFKNPDFPDLEVTQTEYVSKNPILDVSEHQMTEIEKFNEEFGPNGEKRVLDHILRNISRWYEESAKVNPEVDPSEVATEPEPIVQPHTRNTFEELADEMIEMATENDEEPYYGDEDSFDLDDSLVFGHEFHTDGRRKTNAEMIEEIATNMKRWNAMERRKRDRDALAKEV